MVVLALPAASGCPEAPVSSAQTGRLDAMLPGPVPAAPVFAAASFNPIGKRDPFRNSLSRGEAPGSGSKYEPCILPGGPLGGRWDVMELCVTGIAGPPTDRVALLRNPEGEGDTVGVGAFVGSDWGKVVRVDADRIVVRHEHREPSTLALTVRDTERRLGDCPRGRTDEER